MQWKLVYSFFCIHIRSCWLFRPNCKFDRNHWKCFDNQSQHLQTKHINSKFNTLHQYHVFTLFMSRCTYNTIWRHRPGSTLAQFMTPSHYLKIFWVQEEVINTTNLLDVVICLLKECFNSKCTCMPWNYFRVMMDCVKTLNTNKVLTNVRTKLFVIIFAWRHLKIDSMCIHLFNRVRRLEKTLKHFHLFKSLDSK